MAKSVAPATQVLMLLVKTAARKRRQGLASDEVLKKLSQMHQPKGDKGSACST